MNLMQEQEVQRLQLKLRDEELQRQETSRQLELSRQTVVDKDQAHLKQISETLVLKEKLNQVEDTCGYYKLTSEEKQQQKIQQQKQQ